MRYTGPKFKLCRREGINLFGNEKYDVRKRRELPGQHGENMPRLSEYGKMLRNKQVLKRIYGVSEKQFKRLVIEIAQNYAKNKSVEHDKAVLQYLERRLDSVILKAGLARTIMQARQIVSHGHLTLNGKKHNIPSYYIKPGDVISVKDKVKSSVLYANSPLNSGKYNVPAWLKVDTSAMKIEVLDMPNVDTISVPADVLKVIEFYARA